MAFIQCCVSLAACLGSPAVSGGGRRVYVFQHGATFKLLPLTYCMEMLTSSNVIYAALLMRCLALLRACLLKTTYECFFYILNTAMRLQRLSIYPALWAQETPVPEKLHHLAVFHVFILTMLLGAREVSYPNG